ncbi:hypothetical protein DF039_37995 [Burkholderia cenocepacia]|nr:hypothetical protein DF039_37995 [Burkholderia cenocepacia]
MYFLAPWENILQDAHIPRIGSLQVFPAEIPSLLRKGFADLPNIPVVNLIVKMRCGVQLLPILRVEHLVLAQIY